MNCACCRNLIVTAFQLVNKGKYIPEPFFCSEHCAAEWVQEQWDAEQYE